MKHPQECGSLRELTGKNLIFLKSSRRKTGKPLHPCRSHRHPLPPLPGHRGPLPPLGPAGGLRRGRLDGGHSHLGHDPAGSGRSGTFPDGHEIRRPGGGGPSPPPGPEIMVQADGPGGNPAGTVCLSALDAGHFQPQPGSSISRPQPSPEPATLGGKNSWTGNLTWRKSSQGSSSPQEPQGHSFSGMQ